MPAPAPNPANAQEALSGFDGANLNGLWQLYAYDDNGNDLIGAFKRGWLIQITAEVEIRR